MSLYVRAECSLCETASGQEVHLRRGPYTLLRCGGCGLISTTPVLSEKELAALYEDYYSEGNADRFQLSLAERFMRFFRNRRAARIHRTLRGKAGNGRVLDIGCGRGYTLQRLQQLGHPVYGTQVSLSAARFAREQLGLKNVFHGDLLQAGYPDGFFDFISIVHVVEHLADPLKQLKEARRVLAPGGLITVELPNAGSLSARWLKTDWLAYDLPRHRFHFTPASLELLAEKAGLKIEQIRFFSVEYSPATVLFSLLSAIFRDDHAFFRALSSQGQGKPLPKYLLLLEACTGALLAVPVTLFTLLAAACRKGDTMGIQLSKRPDQPLENGPKLAVAAR